MEVEPLVAVTAGDGVITKKVAVFWAGAGELVAVLVTIPGEADEMIFVLWLTLGLAAGMGAAGRASGRLKNNKTTATRIEKRPNSNDQRALATYLWRTR